MTVDEAMRYSNRFSWERTECDDKEALRVLCIEVMCLRGQIFQVKEENARLNDALGQVYSSTEDA